MPMPLSEACFASEADRQACRAMIKNGSKSFAAASILLPRDVREAAYALYAFCRLSDDLIDLEGGAATGIARLRARLADAYGGRPWDHPVDRAFADTVATYRVPVALPEALIDGLDWDVRSVVCETLSDVFAYSARVAGAVGAMMAVLMDARSPAQVARACDLGVAMQLTNIARDVGEDARNGRLYLPRDWLREAGLDPDVWLAQPAMSEALAGVVARLLAVAETIYARADAGIANLPRRFRSGIFAARRIYAAIGNDIAQHGHDAISRRAHVPGGRKVALAIRAVGDTLLAARRETGSPPLAETAFLVAAVCDGSAVVQRERRRATDRIVWVAELFAELKLRERAS